MKQTRYILLGLIFLIQCAPNLRFSHMGEKHLYGLHGKLLAQEGKGQELSAILLEASSLMKSAEGCHLYAVSIDQEHPNEVWISEIWDSQEDHDNSLSIPGVKELIGKAIPLLAAPPQKGQELEVLGGWGIN